MRPAALRVPSARRTAARQEGARPARRCQCLALRPLRLHGPVQRLRRRCWWGRCHPRTLRCCGRAACIDRSLRPGGRLRVTEAAVSAWPGRQESAAHNHEWRSCEACDLGHTRTWGGVCRANRVLFAAYCATARTCISAGACEHRPLSPGHKPTPTTHQSAQGTAPVMRVPLTAHGCPKVLDVAWVSCRAVLLRGVRSDVVSKGRRAWRW